MKNRMQDLDFEQNVAFDKVQEYEFTRRAAQRFRCKLRPVVSCCKQRGVCVPAAAPPGAAKYCIRMEDRI